VTPTYSRGNPLELLDHILKASTLGRLDHELGCLLPWRSCSFIAIETKRIGAAVAEKA
jgi:hypothetical protein